MCGIGCYHSGKKLEPQITETIITSFCKIQGRGPDRSFFDQIDDYCLFGFHRLAIMDLSTKGDQPFVITRADGSEIYTIANGEIFNYHDIIVQYDLETISGSDCEVIPLLYEQYGITKVLEEIRGEFAFVIYDTQTSKIFASRDPIGVRPLFLGVNKESKADLGLCSQLKGLSGLYDHIEQFKPGYIMTFDQQTTETTRTRYYHYDQKIVDQSTDQIESSIREIFTSSVKKRLMSDRPLGCLLSGGLDSSICSAIAQKYSAQPIKTFTIGMAGATDTPFAEKVAKHIGSDHTTFLISPQEALAALDETIRTIESFDITTVRASTRQYILAKKIREHSDVKVLLCGELSDELMGGYKYFHNAPDPHSFHEECIRLVQDIYRYDGLRTDRTMAENGLEVRLPFADVDFVDYFLSIDPALRIPRDGQEKYLFRKAFDSTDLLPPEVLRRSKEALSDGTSSKQKSRFQVIQDHIDLIVSHEEFEKEREKYTHCTPRTKEAYYYRKKFGEYFGEQYSGVIPYYRLPKRCGDVIDPSARVLDVYK